MRFLLILRAKRFSAILLKFLLHCKLYETSMNKGKCELWFYVSVFLYIEFMISTLKRLTFFHRYVYAKLFLTPLVITAEPQQIVHKVDAKKERCRLVLLTGI